MTARKVLIIDDEPDIRQVLRLSLKNLAGIEVIEAASGADGLRAAEDGTVDAILLDVMMPELDGPATLLALRANTRTAAIPVVFFTAKTMRSEFDRLRALGAAAVFVKPFDPFVLVSDLQRLFGWD